MKLAAIGLGLIILILPFSARADENLVAKRELCRQEARTRIVPKTKIAVDEYRRIVERRNAYVSECMGRTSIAVKEPPTRPKTARQEMAQSQTGAILVKVRKQTTRWTTGSIKRRTGKTASVKASGRKRVKAPSYRKRR